MVSKRWQFILILTVITTLLFPAQSLAASRLTLATQSADLAYVLANGQFVYGPNIGDFDVRQYIAANAPHLQPQADVLYVSAQYFSINPKVYLTLLEMRTHLISAPNVAGMANPLGLSDGDLVAQVESISETMNNAYYERLYADSSAPVDTNAATYAIISALARMNTGDNSALLNNADAEGFYQTYKRLFGDDNPLDESNQVTPSAINALAAPDDLLQFPWLQGQSWFFGGVHSNGFTGTDFSALDFGPGGLGTYDSVPDTSNAFIVAAAAGTATKAAACYLAIEHGNGWRTTYYHIEGILVNTDDVVTQNQKVAIIANTLAEAVCPGTNGSSSGPHVHFNLYYNGSLFALNGTRLSGWRVHAGLSNYDTDPANMWIEKNGVKKYANVNKVLSEAPPTTVTPPPTSDKLIFKSQAKYDGWVLESNEGSSKGGTRNSAATTFNLGDDATDKQYRGILSFNTDSIPDATTITKVTLKIKKSGVTGGGNPVSIFKGFMADLKSGVFGTAALAVGDFQAGSGAQLGSFNGALANGWYQINLTDGSALINKTGLTQIRLRFKLGDNDNGIANFLALYSGNAPAASRPQLVIEY